MTEFTVINHNAESVRQEDSRAAAEERVDHAVGEFDVLDESDLEIVQGAYEEYTAAVDAKTDGGNATVMGEASYADDGGSREQQTPTQTEPEVVDTDPTDQLPDDGPSVDEDPLTWMPSEFTDTIEGTVAINRKGYEVMAHHYGIGTSSTCEVGPEETDFQYARVHATATTEDGVRYEAQGSAHVERGDDMELLLEMADTRARKRAVAQATGVGMVAVEELKNEL